MSASDVRMLADLTARVERLETRVAELGERSLPKDLTEELYGAEADHTEDREMRAQYGLVKRGPGRPRKEPEAPTDEGA